MAKSSQPVPVGPRSSPLTFPVRSKLGQMSSQWMSRTRVMTLLALSRRSKSRLERKPPSLRMHPGKAQHPQMERIRLRQCWAITGWLLGTPRPSPLRCQWTLRPTSARTLMSTAPRHPLSRQPSTPPPLVATSSVSMARPSQTMRFHQAGLSSLSAFTTSPTMSPDI